MLKLLVCKKCGRFISTADFICPVCGSIKEKACEINEIIEKSLKIIEKLRNKHYLLRLQVALAKLTELEKELDLIVKRQI